MKRSNLAIEWVQLLRKNINSHEVALLGWKKKARRACVYRRLSYKLWVKWCWKTGECKGSCQPFVKHISKKKMDRFVKKVRHSRWLNCILREVNYLPANRDHPNTTNLIIDRPNNIVPYQPVNKSWVLVSVYSCIFATSFILSLIICYKPI